MSSKRQEPDYARMRKPDGWPDVERTIAARPSKVVQTNIENFSGTAYFLASPSALESIPDPKRKDSIQD